MMLLRKSEERGHANHGWLDSYHSFSFADYYNPAFMGFSVLRVINEDLIAGGTGFGTHPHRDMEIITYVMQGALEHKDSMGNGSVIRAGDVQRMTAGSGVSHSEFNASASDTVHMLQIWILPQRRGLTPSYEQISVPRQQKLGRLRLIAGPDTDSDAVLLHQDARLYASLMQSGDRLALPLGTDRSAWVQLLGGSASINEQGLKAGDGLGLKAVDHLSLGTDDTAELLVFDLPR